MATVGFPNIGLQGFASKLANEERNFEEVVKDAEQAAALVLVY
jgi:hypothetical protein